MTDVRVENHGSVFLFHLETDAARAWAEENVDTGGLDYLAFPCEARYARDIADGMIEAGLVVT